MNIFLIGMMGSGKTTIGRLIATHLNYSFIDTDTLIESTYAMKISDIFINFGEEAFRRMETDALINLGSKDNCVIATGGGIVLKEKNRQLLRQIGTTVWLQADTSTLAQRIAGDKANNRPLANVGTDDLKSRLDSIYTEREDYYASAADIAIDGCLTSNEEIVGGILEQLMLLNN